MKVVGIQQKRKQKLMSFWGSHSRMWGQQIINTVNQYDICMGIGATEKN